MNTLKHIEIIYIFTRADKGSTLENSIMECIELSAKQKMVVTLAHNDNIYTIDPLMILSMVEQTRTDENRNE